MEIQREEFIYYIRAAHGPCEIRGTEPPEREIVTKERSCPMRNEEMVEKGNRTLEWGATAQLHSGCGI